MAPQHVLNRDPSAGPGRLGPGAARAACGQRPGGLEEPPGM